MKRRLTSAYDHMTMPDRCADSIERKLQEGLEQRKQGRYMKVLPGTRIRRNGWTGAAVLVCLLVVLSVSGTMLFLHTSDGVQGQAAQTVSDTAVQESIADTAPEDYYALVTNRSVEEVEAFARVVRYNVLQENWEALKKKISYPLMVQGQQIQDEQAFLEWMDAFSLYSSYARRMEQESCTAMFCNWQGICMADGLIWFNEVGGKLKITAINMGAEPETVRDAPVKQVPEDFEAVLSGQNVNFHGNQGEITLEEYCAALWGDVTVDRFAVVDMDGDNICEMVVSVQMAEAETRAHLVLRKDEATVCGYSFQPGELLDLKKDGGFFRRDRDHRIFFDGKDYWHTEEVQELTEKPLAQWHAYPCLRPELVLESYEYVTGTGQSMLPGMPYYYFESILHKKTANDWEVLKPDLFKTGRAEADVVYLFDPDAPGTVLYGTLTDMNGFEQFETIGFYISNEYGELQAEVRNFLSDAPEYLVGTHLELLDSHGRQVQSPEEMIAYFGFTPVPDGKTLQDTNAIKTLIDDFTAAYLAGDTSAMKIWLADDYQGNVEGFSRDWEVELMNYGVLPERAMEVGDTFQANAGLRQSGIYHGLNLDLVKQENGWKIRFFQFSPSEK